MRREATFATVLCLLWSVTMFGQTPVAPPTETIAPSIPGVVAAGTKVEIVLVLPEAQNKFQSTEGPTGMPDGSLLFAESNRITKIDKDGKASTFLENTNRSNGLALDSKGRLISTQTTPGNAKVGVLYPKGSETVLADNFEGKPYNRPNDLVVDKKDGVYFTEFSFPVPAAPGSALPGVYYISPSGQPMKVADASEPTVIDRPNGIMLSPDEKTLYVDTNSEYMLAFDVQPDGTLQNRRNFARYEKIPKDPPARGLGADGMAVDSQGRIYAATAVGIQVYSPTGQHLGIIPTSRRPQNLAFAGPDKKTLYISAGGVIFKAQMIAQGYKGRAR